ncbi:MAG: hypothetical protein E6J78_01335 [Deltaproteobacteria bacterium]|nr:MAG: hypothetical protein E6J78_01335 [Deltaproteobacteria bacterium]
MKKTLLAVVLGAVLGLAASLANSKAEAASGGTVCGPKICTSHQECCVSAGPITYTCVKPGTCRWN